MRYLMKQKLFAWGEDFAIKNEQGEDVYFVDGRAFSIGAKLSFRDLTNNELAFINEELFTLGPTYNIYRDGAVYATVKKAGFSLRNARFVINIPNVSDLVAEGSFLEHNYTIRRGDTTVATISKQWFTVSDTYGVDIAEGEDVVLLLG